MGASEPDDPRPLHGYELGALLGRGGMGEVHSARDHRIDREVAVKRIRQLNPSSEAVVRFTREARIQARLDHPAIVPVHELGEDADGRPYFTMKRLTGVTLAERLAKGGPLQPLLRPLVDVCFAIAHAHSRNIVHRDLKPSNIMLGDYGEVYVLDWGVARELGTVRTSEPGIAAEPATIDTTKTGAILARPATWHRSTVFAIALVIVGNFAVTLVVARYAVVVMRAHHAARRRVEVQAWHLRQLLPRVATAGP